MRHPSSGQRERARGLWSQVRRALTLSDGPLRREGGGSLLRVGQTSLAALPREPVQARTPLGHTRLPGQPVGRNAGPVLAPCSVWRVRKALL